jgi:hypothetical protein
VYRRLALVIMLSSDFITLLLIQVSVKSGEGQLSRDRKIESRIGAVGLMFAGILAGTAYYQLDAMQAQLDDIKNGHIDTKTISEGLSQHHETRAGPP